MNSNISRLARIAGKKSRLIIGLMSGTSMDGLDVALCRFTGSGRGTRFVLKEFTTIPYSIETKNRIAEVFAKKQVDFVKLSNLNALIGTYHAKIILDCLKKWKVKPMSVDVIASHGQTVMHAPAFLHPEDPVNSTFQIGDGDHIAHATGIITISDFRQKHVAAGGEGAPLAVYGDYLLLGDKKENRILLNIGGIANFTFLPAGNSADNVFVTDTGPGNTMIDQYVRENFPGEYFDRNSQYALKGTVNQELLASLKSDHFFKMAFPKTTGPELFNMEYLRKCRTNSNIQSLSVYDVLATLTRFTAETVSEAIRSAIGRNKFSIYVSGGGAHNPLLMKWITETLDQPPPDSYRDTSHPVLRSTSEIGMSGDAKEAVLFAALANETLAGKKTDFGKRTKIPSVRFGKISFPD